MTKMTSKCHQNDAQVKEDLQNDIRDFYTIKYLLRAISMSTCPHSF